MVAEEKKEETVTEQTESKRKPGRPVGSKNKKKPGRPKVKKETKRKPGRPVGSKNKKKIVIKKTKKLKKGPGRPKIVRVAIKTPNDLIAYMKDLDQKRTAGISAAKRVIRSTVEEITITTDPAKEKELISQLRQMKALVS